MKILIAGSRTWTDECTVRRVLHGLYEEMGEPDPSTVELIHGNDPSGADMMCDKYAVEAGWSIKRFSPDWNKYKKEAFDFRNAEMSNYGADIALVFFSERSPKTDKLVDELESKNIPYRTFWEDVEKTEEEVS